MTDSTQARDDMRNRVQRAVTGTPRRASKPKPVWVPPTVADADEGYVLAFDQTFTNTGWALVVVREGRLDVLDVGMIKEPPIPDVKGAEDTLQRATWMATRIKQRMDHASVSYDDVTVVHEMPAVAGMRIESSLLGGLGVWLACEARGVKPVMVNNKHMRKVLLGDARIKGKPPIKQALTRYLTPEDLKRTTIDSRDAIALALTYLIDRKAARG